MQQTGDWKCSKCSFVNFKDRVQCSKCNTSKVETNENGVKHNLYSHITMKETPKHHKLSDPQYQNLKKYKHVHTLQKNHRLHLQSHHKKYKYQYRQKEDQKRPQLQNQEAKVNVDVVEVKGRKLEVGTVRAVILQIGPTVINAEIVRPQNHRLMIMIMMVWRLKMRIRTLQKITI